MKENELFLCDKSVKIYDESSTDEIVAIGRALESPIRIEIIRLLNKYPLSASEIAKKLNLQVSSVIFHLKLLEDADLISYEYSTKYKGTLKKYSYKTRTCNLIFRPLFNESESKPPFVAEMSIGSYTDAEFPKDFGMASDKNLISIDDVSLAFIPERLQAEIIWFRPCGSLTYAFPNKFAKDSSVKDINFSMEICSESIGYNNDFPSDISFFINDTELGTFTVSGDYGDRYGKYTPSWWFTESTKYGQLVQISVNDEGVYINGKLINKKVRLSNLNLDKGNKFLFRIAVKDDAVKKGGLNIFGKNFGDYNQAIIFTANYK